jgi:hypothetical protein
LVGLGSTWIQGNDRNLVGIWWESFLVQVKFGWVLTDMIFLSFLPFHLDSESAWIRVECVGHSKVLLKFPQGPLTTEVPKAVSEIGLVASAFEAKCGAEVNQRRFVHLVTAFAKRHQ